MKPLSELTRHKSRNGNNVKRILAMLLTAFVVSTHPPIIHSDSATCVADNVLAPNLTKKIYFKRASAAIDRSFADNARSIDSLTLFLRGCDSLPGLRFDISGSASPEGSAAFNRELTRRRASAIEKLIRSFNIGAPIVVTLRPVIPVEGQTAEMLRYAEVTASSLCSRVPDPAPEVSAVELPSETDTLPAAGPAPQPVEPSVAAVAEEPEALPVRSASGPRFFMTTNLLYDAALTPNIGIGVCFGERFTIFADWMHAWWSNREKRRYWRIYGGDIEARVQLGHGRSDNPLSGHRVGLYASLVTYDFQFGRTRTGVMADKYNYAAGLSYGYSLPVGRWLNLDFSIGVGYAWGRYMKQHLEDDHDVWQSTHSKRWFGPTRAEIGLTWLIGKGNVNTPRNRKGGDR